MREGRDESLVCTYIKTNISWGITKGKAVKNNFFFQLFIETFGTNNSITWTHQQKEAEPRKSQSWRLSKYAEFKGLERVIVS